MAQGNFLQSLFNRGQQQDVYNLPPLQAPAPKLQDIMINQQGQQMSPEQVAAFYAPTQQQIQPQGLGANITNALFGQQSPQREVPTQVDTNSGTINAGLAQNPRTGGLLNDIASGFQQNASTPFAVSNLEPQQNKGFATRLGEGFGSLARFADSTLGRMALTAGIVGATGGSGLQALTYGATAGVGNQALKTQDQFYRNQLEAEGVDTSNIQGYITPEMYKNQSLGQYRIGSLELKETLGLLGDNTKRANLIAKALNDGSITPEEAKQRMQEYGITLTDMAKSNQTRNADINEYLAPARRRYYEAMPGIAQQRIGIQEAQLGLEAPYKQAQTAKIMGEMYKPYAEKQLKSQETLNNIDYAENLINRNKSLVGVYSPVTAQVGRLTGGTIGMSRADLANRGEIARTIGTIKNDLLSQARNSGQTGINTMAEINQATAGLDENSSAEELLGALKSMRSIANRTIKQTPSNISPFMPNVNLTPIPQSAFSGAKPRPRTTSKSKSTSKKDPLGLGI